MLQEEAWSGRKVFLESYRKCLRAAGGGKRGDVEICVREKWNEGQDRKTCVFIEGRQVEW